MGVRTLWIGIAVLLTAAFTDAIGGGVRWGTFRPGVYAGVKASSPKSPVFGVMYTDAKKTDAYNHIRHDCDDRDKLEGFGYRMHDGAHCGVQSLPDPVTGVNLTTSFVEQDGGWVLRIDGDRMKGSSLSALSLFWYLSLEDVEKHSFSDIASDDDENPIEGDVSFSANFGVLGKYTIATSSVGNKHPSVHHGRKLIPLDKVYYGSWSIPSESYWDVKPLLMSSLRKSMDEQIVRAVHALTRQYKAEGDPNTVPGFDDLVEEVLENTDIVGILPSVLVPGATVLMFQHVLKLPFRLEIRCIPRVHNVDGKLVPVRHSLWNPDSLDSILASSTAAFAERFRSTFNLDGKGFSPAQIQIAQRAISDALGSIGYFHGESIEISQATGDLIFAKPSSLITAVPARAFFPRGFLWDEGFHQMLISRWDSALSEEILESWIGLVKESGWLPREMILGPEARVRVPQEFQPQNPTIANPPTIFIAILQIAKMSKLVLSGDVSIELDGSVSQNSKHQPSNRDRVIMFLNRIYPGLIRHVDWFLRTQQGVRPGSYKWHGRTASGHCLASGIDDFPRPTWNNSDQGHVDLHSWAVLLTSSISAIGEILGEPVNKYQQMSVDLTASLMKFHWDPKKHLFFDFHRNQATGTYEFFHHWGYVNLLPFCLGLIPADSPMLKSTLSFLGDQNTVFSPFGITSMSKSDPLFATGENYWRGPIWINFNYLILSSLHSYGFDREGPNQEVSRGLYTQLRSNLIDNVLSVYQRTGYLWEQYDPLNGNGKRSHPFTGWSSLIVLIMAEQF